MNTVSASHIQAGQVIRFRPVGSKNRLTFFVRRFQNDEPFVNLAGFRCTLNSAGQAICRGDEHFPLLRPTDSVEVLPNR